MEVPAGPAPAAPDPPAESGAARGRLLLDGQLVPGAVVFSGGAIRDIIRGADIPLDRLPARVLDAALVTPGLIDLQVNGGFGHDLAAGGGAALRALARRLPATGVTAFLPTLISGGAERYRTACGALQDSRGAAGATALGLHLEGPFIAAARAGVHARDAIAAADGAIFDEAAARGLLRLVTLAPERPGALPLIARLRAQGVVVSLGHTDATFDELTAGIDAGATMVTHLYNAMSPFTHRLPGAVGAALTDARVVAGLIADGVHLHPAAIKLARAAKGPGGIALVTDAVTAAGLEPGRYLLAGQEVISDGISVRLAADGVTLAGSALTLDQAVRNYLRFTGAPPEEALQLATEVPARLLGASASTKGRLAIGADADLVLWSEELEVEQTLVGGVTVFERRAPA